VSASLELGDLLLLCSDGLHGMLDDAAITNALRLNDDLEQASELLVALANEAGGTDNVSVVLVRVENQIAEAPRCGACGTPIIEGNVFCSECGKRLE